VHRDIAAVATDSIVTVKKKSKKKKSAAAEGREGEGDKIEGDGVVSLPGCTRRSISHAITFRQPNTSSF
jgi:hypothetical protein